MIFPILTLFRPVVQEDVCQEVHVWLITGLLTYSYYAMYPHQLDITPTQPKIYFNLSQGPIFLSKSKTVPEHKKNLSVHKIHNLWYFSRKQDNFSSTGFGITSFLGSIICSLTPVSSRPFWYLNKSASQPSSCKNIVKSSTSKKYQLWGSNHLHILLWKMLLDWKNLNFNFGHFLLKWALAFGATNLPAHILENNIEIAKKLKNSLCPTLCSNTIILVWLTCSLVTVKP